MKNYFVIGEAQSIGEKILYQGSKQECIDWIWKNCDMATITNTFRCVFTILFFPWRKTEI
jgi:hypothetical protein